jgi:hypothetical protein
MLVKAIDDDGAPRVDREERIPIERFERQIHRFWEMLLRIDRRGQNIDKLRAAADESTRTIDVDPLAHGAGVPARCGGETLAEEEPFDRFQSQMTG